MLVPTRTRRHLRTTIAVGLTAMLGTVLAVGCGDGSSTSADISTTTTTAVAELQYQAHADPATPITVQSGHRFAILLPADPGSGWRWVMAPVDTNVVVPLGSEFRDDPELLARTVPAVTSTTTSSTITAAPGANSTATSTAPTSTSPPALALVQILSFAGRAVANTTITFNYERIGGSSDKPTSVVFTVQVVPDAPTTTLR